DPKVGNHFKRMVRDRVRYSDKIFCPGGKIVKALLDEANGSHGGYSSMHIRRGDFQWANMRITAEEWYEHVKDKLLPGELVYIATDEMNRTFFEPLKKHYKLRFLSDYHDLIGMDNLDPNYMGMIDQVVSSRGRIFIGTYFSSFSAFIGRMRAYSGISSKKMYYGSSKQYELETHKWVYPHSSYSAREFPLGWAGIDSDHEPTEEDFY
ncbi:hypothetical protein ACHAXS_001306, partial [Conticribra weissflogii]